MKTSLVVAILCPLVAVAAVPLSKPRVELATELLKLPAKNRLEALSRQSERMYETLIDVARGPEHTMNIRWRAVTSAALLRREKAADDLMKLAEAKEWYLRNASLVAMAEVSPAKSVSLARRLLKDPALVVRSAAVDVLKKNAKPAERRLLWEEMDSDYNRRRGQSLWIRGQILEALAENPQQSELPLFSRHLSEADETVQKASMKGLENLTGLQVARNAVSHSGAVRLWKAHLNRQPSSELR